MKNWREPPAPIPREEIEEHYQSEVVIVGMGYAGSAAVRAAAEAGADTIGIDAMYKEIYQAFGKDIGHINSKFLESRGVPKVDPIDFFNEWMRRSNNKANPGLIMKYCQKNGENMDWFFDAVGGPEAMDELKISFWPAENAMGRELTGGKFWIGTAQFKMPGFMPPRPVVLPKLQPKDLLLANQAKAEEAGARLFYGIEALYLLKDGKRVSGVVGKRRSGGYVEFRASKGVVLACGDFAGDVDMVNELCTDVYDLFVGPDKGFKKPKFGRNGAGVKMGYWAGGRIEPRPVATMGGNHQLPGGLGANFSQLLLNCEGKRYCNELYGDPVHAGFPGAQMKRGECYSIYDSEFTKFLENAVCSHGGFDRSDPVLLKRIQDAMAGAKASENGYFHYELGGALNIDIWCGNTVEELAKNAGLSEEVAKNMATSVKRYNELCEKGRDEDFGRLPSLMVPLNNPPYYLTKIPPFRPGFMLVTVGGLETDENQNVLDDAYERIPGLYATGNCCGRRFGPQYSTPIAGVSIGCAIVLGREAGIAAATL